MFAGLTDYGVVYSGGDLSDHLRVGLPVWGNYSGSAAFTFWSLQAVIVIYEYR